MEIEFPVGGLARDASFHRQRPFTTVSASNVQASGPLTDRGRGGSRPGLSKAFLEDLSEPVQMLATVRPAVGTAASIWRETFETYPSGMTLSPTVSPWATLGGLPSMYTALDGSGKMCATLIDAIGPDSCAALAPAVTADTTKTMEWSMIVRPPWGDRWLYGHLFGLTCCLLSGNNPTVNGIRVYFQVVPGTTSQMSAEYSDYAASTEVHADIAAAINIPDGPCTLTVRITGSTCQAFINGTQVLSWTIAATKSSTWGVTMSTGANYANGYILMDEVSFSYSAPTVSVDYSKSYAVAAANGTVYAENDAGVLAAVSANVKVASDRPIEAVAYGGKLYIADYAAPVKDLTDGTIDDGSGGSGKRLASASVADWTALGLDTYNYVVEVSSSAGTPDKLPIGTYAITSIAAGYLALDCPISEDSAIDFRVIRGPKVYDPSTGVLSLWLADNDIAGEPKGIIPCGCPLLARHMGRMVLAGDPPNIWYMSRAGDPDDWAYGADPDDPEKACAGNVTLAARIGSPLTGLIPGRDDYLLFACDNELWTLYGDPLAGGQMFNSSMTTGMVSARAFCHTDKSSLIMLARDGLYEVVPGQSPQPLSPPVLPAEFKNLDLADAQPSLIWSNVERGLFVFLTGLTVGSGNAVSGTRHYFVDAFRGGLWPVQMYTDHEPYSVVLADSDSGQRLLLGCRDGFVRKIDPEAVNDDGSAMAGGSHVLLGPFYSGDSARDGLLRELAGLLGEASGNVTWSVYRGQTPEEAYQNYLTGTTASATGTWAAGRNRPSYPRVRGPYWYIALTSTTQWEMEMANAVVVALGRVRS